MLMAGKSNAGLGCLFKALCEKPESLRRCLKSKISTRLSHALCFSYFVKRYSWFLQLCLHGFNVLYLKKYGWYKVDARGNKKGVNTQFIPPLEKLAFSLSKNEFELDNIYDKPLDIVIEKLKKNKSYDEMINDFPDIV